jgi:hypothetical protein
VAQALTASSTACPSRRRQFAPAAKAAQAVADEVRLAVEYSKADALNRWDQEEGLRDAFDYEARSFDEKKDLGVGAGYEEVVPAQALPVEGQAAAPVRPEPLRLTQAPTQPGFTLPKELSRCCTALWPGHDQALPLIWTGLPTRWPDDAVKLLGKGFGRLAQVPRSLKSCWADIPDVVAHGNRVKAATQAGSRWQLHRRRRWSWTSQPNPLAM